MIRLHHLNQSRSLRILWLLEELNVPYTIVSYQRDTETRLVPSSLKEIHPLGKSPVIEMDGKIYAESGAITELLIERFAPKRLRPLVDSTDYGSYLQWIHFAESSLMLPLSLKLFIRKAGVLDNEAIIMIRLHHLNQSRSLRILWLLEELNVPYTIVSYQRDTETRLAPSSLKEIHPLGKSPVIEMDGKIYAESGAITELLIERFAPKRLRPLVDSTDYGSYLQWIHFAESSLMLPLSLKLFIRKAGVLDNEWPLS